MEQIGKRLRALREGVRLTQVNMAEILGVQQSRINRFETAHSRKNLVGAVLDCAGPLFPQDTGLARAATFSSLHVGLFGRSRPPLDVCAV